MVVATTHPAVPRLLLPRPEATNAVTGNTITENLSDPRFKRQLNVALGRSHSQRTPRRDVVFSVRQGSMLEKQRRPLLVGAGRRSATARQHDDDEGGVSRRAEAADKAFPTARYLALQTDRALRTSVYEACFVYVFVS